LGSTLVLIHVADGWVARNVNELALRESQEIREDRAIWRPCAVSWRRRVRRRSGAGGREPAKEIAAAASATVRP